jgi:hypothetical protein
MADTRPLIPQPPLTGGRTLESASRLTRVAFKVRRGRLRRGPGWLRTGSVAHVKAARLEPRWAAPDGSGFVVSPPRLQSVRRAGTARRTGGKLRYRTRSSAASTAPRADSIAVVSTMSPPSRAPRTECHAQPRAPWRARSLPDPEPRSPGGVRTQHPVIQHQIDPRPRRERRQPLQELDRVEQQMRRPVRPSVPKR